VSFPPLPGRKQAGIRSKIREENLLAAKSGVMKFMKRIFVLLVACAGFMVVSASAQTQSQSLGDLARQARANKKAGTPKTVFDNDTMPSVNAPQEPAKTDAAKENAAKEDDKDKKDDKDAKKDGDKKSPEDFKKQIEAQKREILQLQRELDVAEREAKLRAAAFYADAGVRLRDSAKFDEDSRKERAEIDSKKQALDTASQKLADLEEQARKAGVPSGQLD
jgi:hypothetical protein